ncbi:6-carboxytetrahydropterin synthase [Cytobacillus oceanisediminis]|uniref:6-carboxytetrahydropterin synthase n=1 Tax=Cytobacillus oceanisediminis TaxID=665099 RepID=UPI001C2262C3|nr:6-carboxytetrahydropterin synthase [Cytobacillus oceanisediminis]MBU8772096.1 6-carboxytetrahydropterin synthase [Cytobacillus oceanisediminis]
MSYLSLNRKFYFSITHSHLIFRMGSKIIKAGANQMHGHNYILDVKVGGELDKKTGMVINISEIDSTIKASVLKNLDGKYLNNEMSFLKKPPTSEEILKYIWKTLNGQFEKIDLLNIRLREDPWLSVMKEREDLIQLTKRYHFSAAHRMNSPYLNAEENLDIFGKCNNIHGHGHNYYLDVTIKGHPDSTTGLLINHTEFDNIVNASVIDRYDHKFLNKDVEEFKGKNATAELIIKNIWDILYPRLSNLYKLTLHETNKNSFEYYGENNFS